MLQNTFIHVPGVGRRTESMLWENGILSWTDFIDGRRRVPVPGWKRKTIDSCLRDSLERFERKDYLFFSRGLPPGESWRVYRELKPAACFLDIETTGLEFSSEITLVGVYDGRRVKTFIRGVNMEELEREAAGYALVVTYNGACFDLPFLRARFPGVFEGKIHVDLRYPLRRLGCSGGLKAIERRLGIGRSPETMNLDGFDAVRLWHEYTAGREESLELLVKYNAEDVLNLEKLMEFAYARLKEETMGRFLPPRG